MAQDRQSYFLPDQRYIGQQAPVAPAPAGTVPQLALPSIGGPQDEYANVEGVTDEFYNTVSQLRSYAHDMQKKYGIDVTAPDYTQPGGGQPFRTFQELSAKAMMTSGDLRERMDQNKLLDAAEIQGQARRVDGANEMALGTPISDRMYHVGISPDIAEIALRLRENVHTASDAEKLNDVLYQPKLEELTKKIQDAEDKGDFAEVGRLSMDLSALRKAVPQTHAAYFSADARPPAKTKNYEAEAFKEIANTALGRWSVGQYKEDVDNDGNIILINRAKEGQRYGFEPRESGTGSKKREVQVPRIIDFWEKKPSGEVWVHFKPSKEDGAKFQPSPERVDDQNPGTVVANFFQSNSHLGNYGTALGQARDLGWTDASGYANPATIPFETDSDVTDINTKSALVSQGVNNYLTTLR
jgi:hypothetical protein